MTIKNFNSPISKVIRSVSDSFLERSAPDVNSCSVDRSVFGTESRYYSLGLEARFLLKRILERLRIENEDKTKTQMTQSTQSFNQYSENETKVWRRNILNQFNRVSSSCLRSHFVISLLPIRNISIRYCVNSSTPDRTATARFPRASLTLYRIDLRTGPKIDPV